MYRVLLVEDDRGIAEALCAQLGDWGFAVRAVENFRDVTGVRSCGRFPTCRSCSSPRRRTTSTL